MQQGPRPRDFHAAPYPMRSSCPSGVHEPAIYLMPMNFLLKNLSINFRKARHKRGSKASRKHRFRFFYPPFGSRNFGSISINKVIGRSGRTQFGNGRQNTKSDAGQ